MTEMNSFGFSESEYPLLVDDNPSQHVYRYMLVDPRSSTATTTTVLDEVPFTSVSYSNVLSGIGEFTGSININPETATFNLRQNTSPGKMTLYVFRDDEVVWGGIIWKRNFDSDSRTLQVVAKTFESYFDHRLQRTTKYWSNDDQFDIARWLVVNNSSINAFNMEVTNKTSPIRRERVMFGYEFKTSGEELQALAQLLDGFDYNVIVYQDTETLAIRRRLDFFYPTRGLSRNATTLQFEYPGAIKQFTLDEDAENSANSVWVIGAGEGTEQLSARADNYDQLNAGWPRIEMTRSFKSVFRPSILTAQANAAIERVLTPVTVFEVSLKPDIDPVFGTYGLGDWARFRFQDMYFFNSTQAPENDGFISFVGPDQIGTLDRMARITEIAVAVDDSGIENVTLTLGGYELAEDQGVAWQ